MTAISTDDYSFTPTDDIEDVAEIPPATTRLNSALLPILFIIALQVIYSLTMLNNSAFQDEALYVYAGSEYVNWLTTNQPVHESYGLYFSGLPYFYPLLAGILNEMGGFEFARLLSTVSIAVTTFCTYLSTRKLFDYRSALYATILFAFQSSILFMSRLATYDAMCLALASIGLTIVLHYGQRTDRSLIISAVGCAILLLIAVLSKYAALMFVPSIIAVLAWSIFSRRFSVKNFLIACGISILVLLIIVSGIALVLFLDKTVYEGILLTTADRQILYIVDRFVLLQRAVLESGIIIGLAIVGFLLVPKSYRTMPIYLVILGTTFIPAAYHIYKAESVSFQKHLGYGALFGAMLAGYALMRCENALKQFQMTSKWALGLSLVIITFIVGTTQATSYFNEWPNLSQANQEIRTLVRPGVGRYLAEESEVYRFYLRDVTESWQWQHFYWFYYTDRDGTQLQGADAYIAALRDGYFEVVILRYFSAPELMSRIKNELVNGGNYELLDQIPVSSIYGETEVFIWRHVSDGEYQGHPDNIIE